eukprot:gene9766-13137_t
MSNRTVNSSVKPEYVLKRVNDLINSAVGNNAEKEKKYALEQLHLVIVVKKKNVWSKVYEQLMKRYIELCVDLKDHLTAKDGLHQYRNLCQSVDPNSLEIVIVYLMDLAEARAAAARQKADKVALAAAARVSDLDQEETPESIMLSSMTEEGSKDRTDREVVVPWLKFLWESYRAILELLYKIPKLEKVYHKTCEKAFKFCQEYSRVMEFRRLCDILRMHLVNLQKAPNLSARNIRPQWEWTSEALEYHLQTRFAQLEVATSLELWNEGFRTVEDIYAIILAGKKTPKPKLMVNYYEKLTRIFWVSDNKLFHAYAWYKYYSLSSETRRDFKAEERTVLASCVLLSALTIPSIKDNFSKNIIDEDDVVDEKSQQMALILDFQANPSRQSLLNDLVNRGIVNDVIPELSKLYEALEQKFQPLQLVKTVASAVAAVKAHPSLVQYAIPLQRIIVLKVVQQLSRVYTTLRLDFVHKLLLSGLPDLTINSIEKILIEGVVNKQLQLKLNHSVGSIQFNHSASSGAAVETQVSQFGVTLNKAVSKISKIIESPEKLETRLTSARRVYMNTVLNSIDQEYTTYQLHKALIERRKEGLEMIQQEREKKEQFQLEKDEMERIEVEKKRLELERLQREEERRRKEKEKMDLLRIQKELEDHKVIMDLSEIAALDETTRRSLILQAQNETLKAKEEETRKLNEQAKRLDYITRALRIEAGEVVKTKYVTQTEEDRLSYEAKLAEFEVTSKLKHDQDLIEKRRLAHMQNHRQSFEELLLQKQKLDYDKKSAILRKKLIAEKREQNVARARRLFADEMDRQYEEELRLREIEAKAEQDKLEQEMHDMLRRKRELEEAAEREREKDIARIQKQIADAEHAKRLEDEAKKAALAMEEKKPAAYVPPSRAMAAPTTGGGNNGNTGSRRDPFDVPRESRGFPTTAPPPIKGNDGGSWRGGGGSKAVEPVPAREPLPTNNRNFGSNEKGPSERGSGGFEKGWERGGSNSGFDKSGPERSNERSDRGGFDRNNDRKTDRGGPVKSTSVDKEDNWRRPNNNSNSGNNTKDNKGTSGDRPTRPACSAFTIFIFIQFWNAIISNNDDVIKTENIWTLSNGVQWIGGLDSMFVRNCYIQIADEVLLKVATKRSLIILGIKGLGKIVFINYLMVRIVEKYRMLNLPLPTIVFYTWKPDDIMRIRFTNQGVTCMQIASTADYYLSDFCVDIGDATLGKKIILEVASNDPSNYKRFSDRMAEGGASAYRYHMPRWTLDELLLVNPYAHERKDDYIQRNAEWFFGIQFSIDHSSIWIWSLETK